MKEQIDEIIKNCFDGRTTIPVTRVNILEVLFRSSEFTKVKELTKELYSLIGDEDLDEEKLKEASEGLLPNLLDALKDAGFVDETEEDGAYEYKRPIKN